MSTHRTIEIAAIGLVLAGAWITYQFSGPANAEATKAEAVDDTQKAAPKASPGPRTGEVNRPAPPAVKKPAATGRHLLKLPDGSTVPILNGAFGAPALGWPDDRPWSPIIDKETDESGDEWYVHEDGSRSTTVNRYHTHIGGFAPVTHVANPAKALPMAPDELDAIRKEEERKKALQDAKKKAPGKN